MELEAQYGIPMEDLKGKVDFYANATDKGKYKGFVRRSPNIFKNRNDGELILSLLRQAELDPTPKHVDPKRYAQKPLYLAELRKGKTTVSKIVSVPEPEATTEPEIPDNPATIEPVVGTTQHTEVQFHLLQLGSDMGLDVWVAKNDRARSWKGTSLGEMPRMTLELPTQFNDATHRTIELIDVLWLKGNSIVAAFEVECTTAVYSGLLRMSDLLALQPNLDINLYLVASDGRRSKVEQELLRPTFALRDRPLATVCGFLSFSTLLDKVEGIRKLNVASSLKPEFLQQCAEYFGDEEIE